MMKDPSHFAVWGSFPDTENQLLSLRPETFPHPPTQSLPFSTRPPDAPVDFSCFAHQPTATANYTPVPTFLLIWTAVTWPAPPTVPPVSSLPHQPCRYFTALLPLELCQFIVVGYLCFSSLLLFVFGSCLLLCLQTISTMNYWCQPSDYLVAAAFARDSWCLAIPILTHETGMSYAAFTTKTD